MVGILPFAVPVLAVGEVEGDHCVDQVRQHLLLLCRVQLHTDLQCPSAHAETHTQYKSAHPHHFCTKYSTIPFSTHVRTVHFLVPNSSLVPPAQTLYQSLSSSTPPILLIRTYVHTIQYLFSLSPVLVLLQLRICSRRGQTPIVCGFLPHPLPSSSTPCTSTQR